MDQDMEAISVVVFVIVTVGTLVAGLIGGFYFAKAAGEIVPPGPPAASQVDNEEDSDDPTAPITPMIEIGRSPHDRHRDLTVGNALVKNIEMLEFILKGGERQDKDELVRQIGLIKNDFHSLLGNCSFRPFEYAPGTVVEAGMRSRIQIVEGRAGEERTKIVKTLRCGFLYEPGGGEDPVVIRKAEVEIG
jgi:hypothetical protein